MNVLLLIRAKLWTFSLKEVGNFCQNVWWFILIFFNPFFKGMSVCYSVQEDSAYLTQAWKEELVLILVFVPSLPASCSFRPSPARHQTYSCRELPLETSSCAGAVSMCAAERRSAGNKQRAELGVCPGFPSSALTRWSGERARNGTAGQQPAETASPASRSVVVHWKNLVWDFKELS